MSDEDPSTPLPVVDRPLQRRVAWGLLAGWGKAEIARREGISEDELNAILIGPCMFMLVNIWGVFFKEGDRGDMPLLRILVRWALDFILENTGRVQGAGVAKAFLIRVSFKLGFNGTLKLLCDHIEGVIGIRDNCTPLHGVRGRLVELMSWAIEIALMQLFIYQLGEEEIVRRDQCFRDNILLQEFDAYSVDVYEMPAEAEPSAVVGAEDDPSLADAPMEREPALARAEESVAPIDQAAHFAPWMLGSGPTMTGEVTRTSGPTLSRLAHAPVINEGEARIACVRASRSWPRRMQSMSYVEPAERPPIVRNLLYDSVRHKRRRGSSPPLVRHLPIERAA